MGRGGAMKVETFSFTEADGWSVSTFPTVDNAENALVLVFASPEFVDNDKPFKVLSDQYSDVLIAGCSTSGEIYEDQVLDNSIVVAVIEFERTKLGFASFPVDAVRESFKAGEYLANQLNAPDLKSVILLSDGIEVNGSQLVYGINSILDDATVVTGGLAGDGYRFSETWTVQEGKIVPQMVLGIGLYGSSIVTGYGAEGGWDIFGTERIVTKSEGNIVYEIDHQPALALYKEYLGNRVAELPSAALLFPLSIRKSSNKQAASGANFIVRTILSIDEEEQSVKFAGDIEEGSNVQLMKANFDRLVLGAAHAAELATLDFSCSGDMLSIAISCVGRRLVLGDRTEEELEAVIQKLPISCKQIGFYSYGEISPRGVGYCDLHNQTMTLILIGER